VFDVVLADFNCRGVTAPHALAQLRARYADIPFIVISGTVDEQTAIGVLNSGAADYLLKDRLSRLTQAVRRAIDERQLRHAKRAAENALILAEEHLRFAIDASRVGVWEADLQTGTIRWSEMLEALHGLSPGSFGGTLKDFIDRVEAEDRPAIESAIARAAQERADASAIYRTRWPDGSLHWVSATGRTVYDDGGRPIRAAGIGQDVTERVRLEEQYRQAQKMEAIGLLAGGIAHDFNNLLTAIEGYSTLMAESMAPQDPQQEYLAEVRRAAGRATALTRQLLAFGRRQILEPRVLDLRESLEAMGPMLNRLIGENVEIAVRSTGSPGPVKADPGQIEQVILNLAINARDAMPRGGTLTFEISDARLTIADARSGATVVPGRYTLLTVTDSGHGMDAATQARVFEPFFTTKPKGKDRQRNHPRRRGRGVGALAGPQGARALRLQGADRSNAERSHRSRTRHDRADPPPHLRRRPAADERPGARRQDSPVQADHAAPLHVRLHRRRHRASRGPRRGHPVHPETLYSAGAGAEGEAGAALIEVTEGEETEETEGTDQTGRNGGTERTEQNGFGFSSWPGTPLGF
jgi:PAS domain S-box-containing protein